MFKQYKPYHVNMRSGQVKSGPHLPNMPTSTLLFMLTFKKKLTELT